MRTLRIHSWGIKCLCVCTKPYQVELHVILSNKWSKISQTTVKLGLFGFWKYRIKRGRHGILILLLVERSIHPYVGWPCTYMGSTRTANISTELCTSMMNHESITPKSSYTTFEANLDLFIGEKELNLQAVSNGIETECLLW